MLSPKWLRLRAQIFLFAKGVFYRMTLGVRGALVDGDRVLLVRHTYVPGWQFPGGGVDPGETTETGFAREVFEETGYRVLGPSALHGIFHNVQATDRDHVAFYTSQNFEMAHPFKPNREIAEIGWFDRNALPLEATECTRQRIAEIFDAVEIRANW